jgi:ribonuclease III
MTQPISQYFTDPAHLTQGLTHRSYCNEHPAMHSNERLEFLGDAVLSVIISDRLFNLFPDLPEGDLTSRRSSHVQTSTLAAKSLELGLDKLLLLSRGEEDSGGRTNPGLLANTFEAVLGALFIDSGIQACYDYIREIFPDTELTNQTNTKDPKSLLQEKTQAAGWGTPNYSTVSITGPDHARVFTISVTINNQPQTTGTGTSKQRAETAAAKAALAKIFP